MALELYKICEISVFCSPSRGGFIRAEIHISVGFFYEGFNKFKLKRCVHWLSIAVWCHNHGKGIIILGLSVLLLSIVICLCGISFKIGLLFDLWPNVTSTVTVWNLHWNENEMFCFWKIFWTDWGLKKKKKL